MAITSFDQMVDALGSAYKARREIVPCLLGRPGIGKTQAVHQHARNVGAGKVVTIIASQVLPNEVSGITMPVDSERSMEIYDHARLSSLEDGDILFFDELLEADRSVLSACLTLIESRQMMSGKMLPDVQIVAATNETLSPAQIKESIRQRFIWLPVAIDTCWYVDHICKKYNFSSKSKELLDKSMRKNLWKGELSWNTITPRTYTKLIEWRSVDPKGFLNTAVVAYPGIASDIEFMFAAEEKVWAETKARSVFESFGHHDPTNKYTIGDMCKFIMENDPEAWEKICEELSKIEMTEEPTDIPY